MQRPALFVLAGLCILLLGTNGVLLQLYREAVGRRTPSALKTEKTRSARALATLAEIEDSLSAIGPRRAGLDLELPDFVRSRVEQRREVALQHVAALRDTLERRDAQVADLRRALSAKELESAERGRANDLLTRTLADRERALGRKTREAKGLADVVGGLEAQVRDQEKSLEQERAEGEERRRESATIDYVIGTRSELIADSILVGRGGVLGVGRTLQVSSRLDGRDFRPLDTDRQNTIRIRAARARVMSAQPAYSYELVPVNGEMRLHILSPRVFRTVKRLVIMTGP